MAINHAIIYTGLFVLLSVTVWQLYNRRNAAGETGGDNDSSFTSSHTAPTPAKAPGWWLSLLPNDQYRLALAAAAWCLPIWKTYFTEQEGSFSNPSAGTSRRFDHQLLANVLAQLASSATPGSLRIDKTVTRSCYLQLLAPMVALQDGTWIIAYPLKKSFLAVFTLVESLLEAESNPEGEARFDRSVRHSIDCLELSRLYTNEEVEGLLAPYKVLAGKNRLHSPLNTTDAPST